MNILNTQVFTEMETQLYIQLVFLAVVNIAACFPPECVKSGINF